MMETDDKLMREFFGNQKQEIADNGFSRRVMHHLPDRQHKLAQVWTVFVAIVAFALFFVFGGMQAMIGTFRDAFVSMIQSGYTFDPRALVIVLVVFACLGVRKAYSMI